MRRKKNKNLGFSLIEILIAISIFVILVAMVSLVLNSFEKQRILDNTSEEIFRLLRLAQNKTLASEGNISYGINFENDKATLFKGTNYIIGAPDNEVHDLPAALTISEINLGGPSAVVFERLSGFTANAGNIKIEVAGDASKYKIIYIDYSGAVTFSSVVSDDTLRIKDSRHVHVLFSQSTKAANNLLLFFPADAYSETINFQDYLDAAKTEFNWEGMITVNGTGQTIKVHTHQMTDGETLFCIHRDRRFSSKALSISVDGENFINYLSDGTTIQGTSLFANAPIIQ